MVLVVLLVAGLIVVLVTVLVFLKWLLSRRREPRASVTEAQARENAAPLTTAILPSDRSERPGV
jgi:flagellar biosynthesis/type III secretory pathway M-ring protein FliF/YscJ